MILNASTGCHCTLLPVLRRACHHSAPVAMRTMLAPSCHMSCWAGLTAAWPLHLSSSGPSEPSSCCECSCRISSGLNTCRMPHSAALPAGSAGRKVHLVPRLMLCSGLDHLPTCSTVQRLHTCRRDNKCIPGLQARWAPFAEAVGDAWLGQLTWCQAGTAAQPGQFQLCGLSLTRKCWGCRLRWATPAACRDLKACSRE